MPKVVRYLLRGEQGVLRPAGVSAYGEAARAEHGGPGEGAGGIHHVAGAAVPADCVQWQLGGAARGGKAAGVDVAGKSQVVVVATNQELGEEVRHYLAQDYWVSFGYFRVFFPFNQRRNSPERHRWYDIGRPDYAAQRDGIVHGLLRNHILQERYAVESVWDVNRLVAREKLLKLKTADPEQQKELEEFFKVQAEVEKERDNFKAEAAGYASEVDRLEEQVRQLDWRCKD